MEDVAGQHLSFTTDMWQDTYTQRCFISLSVHFITDDFKLVVKLLGVREFQDDKKTGENILNHIRSILDEFHILQKLNSSVFVTDNGANVVAAFKQYKRLSCACHNLNLVMEDVLKKKPISELKALIDSSKKLVKYFKHSTLNTKLSKTLKQDINTRWNSIFIMLSSIHEVQDEVKRVLIDKNEVNRLAGIDFTLLEALLNFLKSFKDCSEKMSSDKTPTVHIYPLWYEKLVQICNNDQDDSVLIKELKSQTLNRLKVRFPPTMLHLVGLFLNPPFKEMLFLTEDKRLDVIETVKAMLSEINSDFNSPSTSENENLSTENTHEFSQFLDSNLAKKRKIEKSEVDVELERYINTSSSEKCVLTFWKKASDLKLLQILARKILCIPASSATSERLFSTSGKVLNERRTRLKSENLDKIIFLNKNM